MSQRWLIPSLALLSLAGGCCKQNVEARAVVGNLSPEQCRKILAGNDAPATIICPGEPVTICYNASGDGVNGTVITVSPEPGGASGTYGTTGALHFKPSGDTTVKVSASPSDCASTTKSVVVLDHPKPATWDSTWDRSCQALSYQVDPLFISPAVIALDDTALWIPAIQYTADDGSSSTVECTTPPFLRGNHPSDVYFFEMDKPYLTTSFDRPHQAVGTWSYFWEASCPGAYKCNSAARLPFSMTLSCKQ
jgi:hypothetical protein